MLSVNKLQPLQLLVLLRPFVRSRCAKNPLSFVTGRVSSIFFSSSFFSFEPIHIVLTGLLFVIHSERPPATSQLSSGRTRYKSARLHYAGVVLLNISVRGQHDRRAARTRWCHIEEIISVRWRCKHSHFFTFFLYDCVSCLPFVLLICYITYAFIASVIFSWRSAERVPSFIGTEHVVLCCLTIIAWW